MQNRKYSLNLERITFDKCRMQSDFRSFFDDSDIVFYQKAIQFKMLLKLDELVVK